jgi:hypothetical protein
VQASWLSRYKSKLLTLNIVKFSTKNSYFLQYNFVSESTIV